MGKKVKDIEVESEEQSDDVVGDESCENEQSVDSD